MGRKERVGVFCLSLFIKVDERNRKKVNKQRVRDKNKSRKEVWKAIVVKGEGSAPMAFLSTLYVLLLLEPELCLNPNLNSILSLTIKPTFNDQTGL